MKRSVLRRAGRTELEPARSVAIDLLRGRRWESTQRIPPRCIEAPQRSESHENVTPRSGEERAGLDRVRRASIDKIANMKH
jgi:hypothetical protein